MNRESAETFLRLAAEAELRGQLAPAPPPRAGSLGAGRTKVMAVGLGPDRRRSARGLAPWRASWPISTWP